MGEPAPGMRYFMKFFQTQIRRGFTLIELLVVMTIIGIMMALATTVLRSTGTGRTLDSGAFLIENLIQEARATAQGNDTYTRLVIANDPSDTSSDSRHLRYVVVQMLRKTNAEMADGTETTPQGNWVSTSSGVLLPPGIYFSPYYSHALSWADGSGDRIGKDVARLSKNKNTSVYYFEFDEKGRYVAPSAGPGNPSQPHRIVLINARIGKGRHSHDGIVPTQVDGQQRPVGAKGLVIWPAGNTSSLRTRDQIFEK